MLHTRSIRELLFGRPLRSNEEQQAKIGPLEAVPFMGLDALGSAAYGPEAALTVLMPLGAAGCRTSGRSWRWWSRLLVIV